MVYGQVFDVLEALIITFTLFPWAVICAIYLRFRKAVRFHRMVPHIPQKALSWAQPGLAIYALTASLLISIPSGTLS